MATNAEKSLKVTLVKSPIGCPKKHRVTLGALGLRKLNRSVMLMSNPANMGKINQVGYLLKVEEC